jgi:hypothetical protein
MVKALCLDLHLLAQLESWPHLSPGGFGNQNLAASRERLDTRGQIDVAPHDPVLRPFGRANIPNDYLAGVDADSHFDLGQIVPPILFIDRGHGQLHRHSASYSALRIVFLPDRSPKEDEDCVADELVDCALVLLNDRDHGGEVAIKQSHDPFRRQPF